MTNPSQDLLTTTEGVDEEPNGVPNPVSRVPAGAPVDIEAEPAPPVDVESGQSRASRDALGTGQQLEAGEW